MLQRQSNFGSGGRFDPGSKSFHAPLDSADNSLAVLITEWTDGAMRRVWVECTDDDPPVWVARSEGAEGALGYGSTEAEARADLRSALPEWAALGVELGHDIPGMDWKRLQAAP